MFNYKLEKILLSVSEHISEFGNIFPTKLFNDHSVKWTSQFGNTLNADIAYNDENLKDFTIIEILGQDK